MTDLTEQLKKGELLEGWYYVKKVNGQQGIAECYKVIDVITNVSHTVFEFSEDIEQVLAPVPSYEEYLSLTYAKEEDEGIIAEYETENAQLKERVCEFVKANQLLRKKLDKERAKNRIDYYDGCGVAQRAKKLNSKIDEVLCNQLDILKKT